MRRPTLFCLLIALLSGCLPGLSGCAAGDKADPRPAPAESSGPVSPATASSAAGSDPAAGANDPPGAIACAKLAAAITRSSLLEDGVVAEIAAASTEADAPVADAAQRLAAAHAAAVSALGSTGEPDAIAGLSAAAADMHGVCTDSGLTTTG